MAMERWPLAKQRMKRSDGRTNMPRNHEFPTIFEELKSILKKYESACAVEQDTDTDFYLNTKRFDQKNRPVFFGGVSINKISVSFYLMPVHTFPDLLEEMSPELKAHKQGKSCFRFKTVEPALFKELAALAKKGMARCENEA